MAHIQERRTNDGRLRHRVLVRIRGYPTQTATFDRKTDAKRWAQKTESAIREGRYFRDNEAQKHTLGELVDRYIRYELPKKPRNAPNQKAQLEWWNAELGQLTLANVTPAEIAEARDKLASGTSSRKKVRNPATVNRYLAALSHAFTVAVKEWGWVEDNPLLKVTRLKEPQGRVRFLSEDERRRLLNACAASNNRHLYSIVVLAISTGMRRAEIMHLLWPEVDFERGVIQLAMTKNDERRAVPLLGHARQSLQELSKVRRIDTHLVFPARDGLSPMDIRSAWEGAMTVANIADFRFHDLRHTAASYLAMNGASPSEIADVLGHKTLQMVKRYAHLSDQHTAGVVASMNEAIFGPN